MFSQIHKSQERRIRMIRLALFTSGASLAVYVPYKYATGLNAYEGLYALLFPFSILLAVTGMALAFRPQIAGRSNLSVRVAGSALALLWMVAGMACAKSLAATIAAHPAAGLLATFQMLAQHLFLSLAVLGAALFPKKMARLLGGTASSASVRQPIGAMGLPQNSCS